MPSPEIQVEIDAAIASFRWNEANLHQLLSGPSGPVFRDLTRRAIRVEAQAKVNATQPRPSIPGHGPAVRTGRLRGSITWRPGSDERGPYCDIGSSVLYAPYVELGTSRMAARPFLQPALSAARAS